MTTDELFKSVRTGDLKSICNLDSLSYRGAVGKNGQTVLHEAISFSQSEIARHFLENVKKVKFSDSPDDFQFYQDFLKTNKNHHSLLRLAAAALLRLVLHHAYSGI